MGGTQDQLNGVLGALGKKINNTQGVDQVDPPGIGLLLQLHESDGEWHYQLKQTFRNVLDEEEFAYLME